MEKFSQISNIEKVKMLALHSRLGLEVAGANHEPSAFPIIKKILGWEGTPDDLHARLTFYIKEL